MSLFETGIRPHVDAYLAAKAAERRDYGEYWSASQAGYCMRKVIMERMGIPPVKQDARQQRVFEVGHIFHEWLQRITKEAGLSIAQELELQDEELMIRGHIDDLVLVGDGGHQQVISGPGYHDVEDVIDSRLILMDYKTQNSRAFTYQKGKPISHYHKMQLGTYMYVLRQTKLTDLPVSVIVAPGVVEEARILKISKDDLRMDEQQLLWSSELEQEVLTYWQTLNEYWKSRKLPPCTCHEYENGFMASEKYNPYFYQGQPCSIEWFNLNKDKSLPKGGGNDKEKEVN